jgi:Flp pilus assembly protein TadB
MTAAVAAVAGLWLVATGWRQPRPGVDHAIRRLRRAPAATTDRDPSAVARIGAVVSTQVTLPTSWTNTLRLVDRTPEAHLGLLTVAAIVGAAVPVLVLGLAQWIGAASPALWVPTGLAIVSGIAAAAVVHGDTRARAEQVAADLRHQLGAFLDMVTMLLAGNSGYEGALDQAARAGDGTLFVALSKRMRETAATGDSAVVALERVADDYGIVELDQVAATISLSAAEGAPVAASLAAKCATLRSTLAADQEAAVRIRTDKVTPPLVGMALLFMALIIYPALDLT